MGEHGDLGSKGPQGAKVRLPMICSVNVFSVRHCFVLTPTTVPEFQGELSYMQAPKETNYT